MSNGNDVNDYRAESIQVTMQKQLTFIFSVDNFNIYPNTRLGKLVKAKKLEVIHNPVDAKRNSNRNLKQSI